MTHELEFTAAGRPLPLKRHRSTRTGRFAHERKPTAPTFHTSTPDVDNLAKFVLDAMNGHFFVDDSQIVELHCQKVYADGHAGSTAIRICSVLQGAVETTPQPPVVPLLCEPPCVQLFL